MDVIRVSGGEPLVVALAAVIALGTLAQWTAWRLGVSAILLLLVGGFVAGPVTGLLDTDRIFGDLLFPLVSLAAAVVLFEGGLSASRDEIRRVAAPVRRLATIGLLLTWGLGTAAAGLLLGLPLALAALLGAVLVVTGPTVIGPLLYHVRPRGHIGSILKLEGILNDPLGAVLAFLVFEAIRRGGTPGTVVAGVGVAVVVGAGVGVAAAAALALLLRRGLLPPFLANAVTLAVVLTAFAAANALQEQAGLLSATVAGAALASWPGVNIKPIATFNEHLRVVMISALFIVLAARINLHVFAALPVATIAFCAAILLVVRPAAVAVATIGTGLSVRERVFLAAVAPRGIVAAAMASVLGLLLDSLGMPAGDLIIAATFLIIAVTVASAGLFAGPLARLLKLQQRDPQGVLFFGAGRLAREFASVLKEAGYAVLLVDGNRFDVAQARHAGLPARWGTLVSERVIRDLDLEGIGRLVALTPNDEANSLAVVHFRDIFGEDVYQPQPYQPESEPSERRTQYPLHLRGKYIAGGIPLPELSRRLERGGAVKLTPAGGAGRGMELEGNHRADTIPLAIARKGGRLDVVTGPVEAPAAGDRLVSLVGGR